MTDYHVNLPKLEKPAIPYVASDSGVIVVVLLNIAVFAAAVLWFIFMKNKYKFFYSAQTGRGKSRLYKFPEVIDESSGDKKPVTQTGWVPAQYTIDGKWNWLTTVWRASDDQIFRTYGIDALTYLQFQKFGAILFLLMSVVGVLLLVPVNLSGNAGLEGLNATSMSNLEDGDARHWFHLIVVYIFTGGLTFMAWMYFREYINRMHQYRKLPIACNYSAFVKGIPPEVKNAQQLYDQFDQWYPGQVASAHLIYNTEALETLLSQEADYKKQLQSAEAEMKITGERPKHKIFQTDYIQISGYFIGDEVDSIEFYTKHLNRLKEDIPKIRASIAEDHEHKDYPATDAGFVTFNTLMTANQVAQVEYTSTAVSQWRVRFAPHPEDLNWDLLKIGLVHSLSRTILVIIIVAALIFVWAFPVGFIAQFSNLHNFQVSWMASFSEWVYSQSEIVISIITRMLPTLALVLIMLLPVWVFRWLSYLERLDTKSNEELSSFRGYYLFLLFNILLLAPLTSQVTPIVNSIVDNPSGAAFDLARTMATTLPPFGAFFINYFLNSTFTGGAIRLTRIDGFLFHVQLRLRRAKGRIERSEIKRTSAGRFEYDGPYAVHLTAFTIALVYSSLDPIILPVAALYFLVQYVIDKYNIMFVHYECWDASGKWGRVVYRRVLMAMMLYHFVMFGMFLIKKAVAASFLIFPLFLFDILVLFYANKIFARRSEVLPLDQAAGVTETATTLSLTNKYRQPALKPQRDIKDIYFLRDADSDNEEDIEDMAVVTDVANGDRRLSLDSNPPEFPPTYQEDELGLAKNLSAPASPRNNTAPKRTKDEDEVELDDVM